MIRYPSSAFRENECAVALVIVLAFVVLITGVVIAFFSNSLLYRQISNSSANATKVDLFAQGAMDAIVGDLKQEIAAGSNATMYTDANGNAVGQVYRPFNPNTAIPAQALSANASAGLSFASNLVKRSAYGQNFFPSGSDPGSASYNNGNTSESIAVTATPSASPSPAPKYLPSNRAAKSSTLSASQNGRFISLARWNKALLLPKVSTASDTDFTPVSPANGTSNVFVAPDWVLVARDGSNPTGAFNGNMASSSTAASSVIGRYAYAIYDEGGLLDMNAAGYPTDASGKSDLNVVYKAGLPFADLTQLPGISALSSARQKSVVNSLVGWRNYASAQLTGGSLAAGFTFSGTPLTNFTTAMWGNTTGFLKTANTTLANGQSDRMFVTRQEMMNLLVQGIASSGGQSDRANVQNALQYLASFSRAINQPSFVPATFIDPANAPKVLTLAQGGNKATGLDQQINPSFLNVPVQGAFTRNDGTQAKIGEPLVKKRFALNRLAWLTFKGPLSDGLNASPTTVNADATIQSLAQQLHDTYGLSWQFLQLGTAANIQSYFGLTWQKDTNTSTSAKFSTATGAVVADNQFKWFYNKHNGATGTGSTGSIMKLGNIAALGASSHEPDFFELLKAGINVGSIGKASMVSAAGDPTQNAQYNKDIDVDAQIIQVGANIIDQFDLDGYPSQIVFDNGFGPTAFFGVENLPYIYRVRDTYWKVRLSIPDTSSFYSAAGRSWASPGGAGGGFFVATSGTSTDDTRLNASYQTLCAGPDAISKPAALTDTGTVYMMAIPDLWNPHDLNSPRGALDSGGNPLYPTSFRVVATSAPLGGPPQPFSYQGHSDRSGYLTASNGSIDTSLPFKVYQGYGSDSNNGWGVHARKVTTANSGMYFTIDKTAAGTGLFREPTLLYKVGLQNGTNLTGIDPTGNGENNAIVTPKTANDDGNLTLFAAGGGVQVDPNLATGVNYNQNLEPQQGQIYLGVYFGAIPLASKVKGYPAGTQRDWATIRACGGTGPSVTYIMQCLINGSWVTYDTKYTRSPAGTGDIFNNGAQLGSEYPHTSVGSHEGGHTFRFLDPRTSRFGPLDTQYNFNDTPPRKWPSSAQTWTSPTNLLNATSGMLDAVNGVICPDRADLEGGLRVSFSGSLFPTAGGWYLGGGNSYSRIGLLTQNRSDVFDDNKTVSTDGTTPPTTLVGQYYTDADGVLRRAMGAYVKPDPAKKPAITTTGLPQTLGGTISNGSEAVSTQSQSRPFILNRPFRSVTELGYTFSGTPWKNLDFFTPESGQAALLDVFCIADADDSNGMVAGRLNLNTHQAPALQAVLSGGYKDETKEFATPPIGSISGLTATDAQSVAAALVLRTTQGGMTKSNTTSAPLSNIAALVGTYASATTITGSNSPVVSVTPTAPNNIDGNKSYDGLSKDLDYVTFSADATSTTNIQRFRESAIRPLVNIGQTRVWNVMIDMVAQTGRYPLSATALTNFVVEGEQRYWVHLAIDRYSGQVIDKQIEVVKE